MNFDRVRAFDAARSSAAAAIVGNHFRRVAPLGLTASLGPSIVGMSILTAVDSYTASRNQPSLTQWTLPRMSLFDGRKTNDIANAALQSMARRSRDVLGVTVGAVVLTSLGVPGAVSGVTIAGLVTAGHLVLLGAEIARYYLVSLSPRDGFPRRPAF